VLVEAKQLSALESVKLPQEENAQTRSVPGEKLMPQKRLRNPFCLKLF
jgi:hypothetical protein